MFFIDGIPIAGLDENFRFKYVIDKRLYLEDKRMKEHTFKKWIKKENDYYNDILNYCNNFKDLKDKGDGLILIGDCGTGKTFSIDCIYNELKEKYQVLKTNISTILELLKMNFDLKNGLDYSKFIKNLSNLDLIIFDDLGNEKIGKKIKHKDSDYPYTIMSFITTMKGSEKHYFIYTDEHYFSGSELEIYSRLLNYEVLENV